MKIPVCPGEVYLGQTVLGRLGSGASGTVFLTRDDSSPPVFRVLKAHFGPSLKGTVEDFKLEIFINREQHIRGDMAAFFGSGQLEDGTLFFISEYLHMMEIDEATGDPRKMEDDRLDRFMIRLCNIVIKFHEKYVHCDLKPENIAVTEDGLPKLIDFGCAVRIEDVGERSIRCGSWDYMGLEVVAGRWIDQRADVHALGVLLKKLASRRMCRKHGDLINRATSNDMKERPYTVEKFLSEYLTDQDRLAKFIRVGLWSVAVALGGLVLFVGFNIAVTCIRDSNATREKETVIRLRAHIIAGLDEFEEGKYKPALEHLQIATNHKDFAELGVRQGEVLQRLKEYEEMKRQDSEKREFDIISCGRRK